MAAEYQYNIYIQRVVKQVHPDTGLSGGALGVCNSIVVSMIEKMTREAQNAISQTGKVTITTNTIDYIVKQTLPGEMGKHAVSEGTKAVVKFNTNSPGGGSSRSYRAGLQFPVGRIQTHMRAILSAKRGTALRISGTAAVYLAAVSEYIAAEILELAGNAARDQKRVRITIRHIFTVTNDDEELKKLIKPERIMGGGVSSNINAKLLPTKKGKKVEEY
jgi:histone H2A